MFDEYFKPPQSVVSLTIFAATLPQDTIEATSSITIDQDAPSPSTTSNTETILTPILDANVEEPNQENEDVEFDSDTFTNLFSPLNTNSAESSSSRIVDTSNIGIFINQSKYALEMLKKYGLEQCDVVDTPMVERSKLDEDLKGTQVDPTRYRSMDTIFDLIAFAYADHAGCQDSRKSTLEHVSLSGCCAHILWMRLQLTNYGFDYNKIPLYCDSKSAIALSCNTIQHSRTKHIAIRYHFIKVQDNLLKMVNKNKLGHGNKKLEGRIWAKSDIKSSKEMLEKIDKTLKHKE
nr:hypothetical protein [Tanacetum cinerariifolium]